jgi:hypothetical protein
MTLGACAGSGAGAGRWNSPKHFHGCLGFRGESQLSEPLMLSVLTVSLGRKGHPASGYAGTVKTAYCPDATVLPLLLVATGFSPV